MHTPARRPAAVVLAIALLAFAKPTSAQPKEKDKVLPPADNAPRLVLTHDAANATVNALAFGPDGTTLYAAGFDKRVLRYKLNAKNQFVPDGEFRVPVSPGNGGLVNSLAVSPGGEWVAVAGRAPIRGEVWVGPADGLYEDYRDDPDDVRGDAGIVYLFDPKGIAPGKAIRGPLREVRAVAFANPAPATGPVLVTAGIELVDKVERGVLRVFDVDTGKQRAQHVGLPTSLIPPAVVAFATGDDRKGLRVAVAWDAGDGKPGKLLVWDDPAPGKNPTILNDNTRNSTLAVKIEGRAVTELLSGGFELNGRGGGYAVRAATGEQKGFEPVVGTKGEAHLPVGLATSAKGVAVLTRVAAKPARHELRFAAGLPIVLKDNPLGKPVFALSPDGKFAAVGGFADNHIEVHALGAKAPVQTIAGAEPGFAKVAFLDGEKLWLGKEKNTTALGGGGVILDLAAKVRAAIPRGANEALKLDSPDVATEIVPVGADGVSRVRVTLDGKQVEIALPADEVATAAAALPAKRGWDEGLGAAVAVAQQHVRSREVKLALYVPGDAKPRYVFGGPTLPVRSLTFSNARPLLAAAGDDGTAAVWSLKGLGKPSPAIEGLMLTTRNGKVVVSVVQKGSAAEGKLKPDDAIESVKGADGKAVKVEIPGDFVQTIRTLKAGDDALVTANGKEVAVKVGTAIGFRLPLFHLWTNPVAAKDGKHAWVGWTPSGPYDASGLDAEARIGWLTATGETAQPTTFVKAEEHRPLFYRPDFIRQLLSTGGYKSGRDLPRAPKFVTEFPNAIEDALGRSVTREKIDAELTLIDPDRALDPARAVVAWQVVSPDGTASEWVREPFGSGRVTPKLSERDWKRGTHEVRAKLFATATAPTPLFEAAKAVEYTPPAPAFAVLIDGKPVTADSRVVAANAKEVTVALDRAFAANAAVAQVTWKPNGAEAKAIGRDALTIALAVGETEVCVTATNAGADPKKGDETTTVRVWVQRPAVIPPPTVTLDVLDPFDARPKVDDPFVVSSDKVRVRATATDATPVKAEWKVGAREWVAAKLVANPPDSKTAAEEIVVDFAALRKEGLKGDEVEVRFRATGKGGVAERSLLVRIDGLPEISVNAPPAVRGPEMRLSGGLKLTSKRKFAVRVLVTSSRTGRTREFTPTPNAELTEWAVDLTLFPGGNQLGYVVRYDSEQKSMLRTNLVEVMYHPAPLILGGGPLEVGFGNSGPLGVAVASDSAPTLFVNGVAVGANAGTRSARVFGLPVWAITAADAPANAEPNRLKPVSVSVRTTDGASAAGPIEVRGAEKPKPPPAPKLALQYSGGPITNDARLTPTGDPLFTFDLRARSEVPLTRVEVWHGAAPDAKLEPIDLGARFDKEANASPRIQLRPGAANYVKVVVSNGGDPVEVEFYHTYLPPPVQVVFDSIREPNGPELGVNRDNALSLEVTKGVIEVKGRVVWTEAGDAAGADPHLMVAFVANGVAHVAVPVQKAEPGKRERMFVGRVFLNSYDPRPTEKGKCAVRAELRSGLRAVPKTDTSRAALVVRSKDPVTKQRLHVLIFGVDVPEDERGPLVRNFVTAIGGKLPANSPNFTEGRFERDRFEFAQVYRPQFENSQAGHLNAMLNRVRRDIADRAKRPGDDEWVNDVVLLFYQGGDWKDGPSGRWLLHTATTGDGKGPTASDEAIRPDALPPVPGMLVVLANVTGEAMAADPLATDTPYLRYAWQNRAASAGLLEAIQKAVAAWRQVGEIRDGVSATVKSANGSRGLPIDFLPDVVLVRLLGLK